MAAQRWRIGRWVVLCAAVAALAAPGLAGCGSDGDPDTGTRGVQRMLDRRAAAVRERDETTYLATVDRDATALRARQRKVFGNLSQVPLASWEYRVRGTGGFTPAAGGGKRLAVRADLRYRLAGYDTAPVTVERKLTLAERGGRWYVAAEESGGSQLWDQGPVTVVRGAHSLVMGVGQDRAGLRALADVADRAVPAVDAAWRGSWAHRVVVELPASLERMAGLLSASPASYSGIAAVTTGEAGGAGAAPADRVIVNPEAYGTLGTLGRQVVLTHETAHVATRPYTSSATPLWLSEGFADWAGYRATDRTARQAAPELARAVARGEAPAKLPADADFGFAGEPQRLARAYEEGWLACRMIADKWGEAKLVAFYREVGDGRRRAGALEAGLRDVLGLDAAEFTARWRAYVQAELG
ncbi:hypothetical protein AB0I49_32230 [Streptomyces sp. NPDC050617]|uniref:hypothetical protein n=1 Tax=Streptomyces sp. NPDC050617 TaxID=3154628 RepID=UPI0034243C2E